jgi:NADH-quinone oxidoreductase subunit E
MDEVQERVDASLAEKVGDIVRRFNVERGSAIPILQAVENGLGYVSKEMIEEISRLTNIPAADLYGIATFYSQFHLEPRGEHVIKVCHGTACHLAGADQIARAVEMATGAAEGHTSPDGLFSHERVACLGCCSLAPVVMVDQDVHAGVKSDKVAAMLKPYREMKKKSTQEVADTKKAEGTGRATGHGESDGE